MTLLPRQLVPIAVLARRGVRSFGSRATPLVLTPQEVNNLTHSRTPVSFLDASWFMPNSPRNARGEFASKRIPGAQFLDLDEVASPHELGLKHMIPTSQAFATACGQLGISSSSHVVIYDSQGVFSSPRALFMFRTFGHDKSSIINGGLPRWVDEGLHIETEPPAQPEATEYPLPSFHSENIRGYDDIVANSGLDPEDDISVEILLDARSRGRYLGTDPEPRPGLSSGHMPNSVSLPFNSFLHKQVSQDGNEYTVLLPPTEIRQVLETTLGPDEIEDIINGERAVVASCGSGMTAGVLWLGLQLLGAKRVAIYDESWTGYAMRPESTILKSSV